MTLSPARALFAHGSVYTISQIVNQSIGLILLPMYARCLGADGFGTVQVVNVISMVLGVVFIQGLQGAWVRLRFDCDGAGAVRRFESSILWYLLLAAVVGVGLASLVLPPVVPWLMRGVSYYPMGLLASVMAAATMFALLYERKLQVEQRPIAFAIFSALRTALTLGAIVWFVAGMDRGAQGRFEGGAIAAILSAIAAIVLIRPESPRKASTGDVRRALRFGLPLVPHNLAGLANSLIDRPLVNLLLGAGATGVYAMGYQVAAVAYVLGVALNQAFTPIFIGSMSRAEQARKEGDTAAADAALRALAQSGLLLAAAVASAIVCLTAVAREALLVIATEDFADSWRVVAVVGAAFIAWICYTVFGQSVMYSVRHVRWIPVITILAAALNIGANLLLIPRMGMMGAAYAALVSNALMGILALWFSRRAAPLPHRWGRWAMLLGCSGNGLVALWMIDESVNGLWLRCMLKAAVAVVVVAIIARGAGVSRNALRQALALRSART